MAKRFLASVANVELFEKKNGKLVHFASAHTLTDSSIGFQISMEDVRGGQGAKLFGRFGHTTGMTLQMTDSMFDINYLRLNLGASKNTTAIKSVLVEGETHTFTQGTDITLSNEAVNIGHLCGIEEKLCWVHKADCEGVGNDKTIPVTGATVASADLIAAGFGSDDILTFSYFKEDPMSVLYDVSATFLPTEVTAVMTAQEFAGDSANVTTGEAVGQFVVKIPRLQLDGQFDLGLNMTSAATVSLNGTALATIDPISGKEYYAEILETNHSDDEDDDFRFGLVGVFISTDALATTDEPVVYGTYADGTFKRISNAQIAAQTIKSASNPTGKTANGFIKDGGSNQYQATALTDGKWGTAATWYVTIFAPSVTDAQYTAIDGEYDAPPTSSATLGVVAYDSETIVSA